MKSFYQTSTIQLMMKSFCNRTMILMELSLLAGNNSSVQVSHDSNSLLTDEYCTIWFWHEQFLQLHYLNLWTSAIDEHKPVKGGEALPDLNERPANVEEFYRIQEAQGISLGNELTLQQYILDIVQHNFFTVPVNITANIICRQWWLLRGPGAGAARVWHTCCGCRDCIWRRGVGGFTQRRRWTCKWKC